MEKIKSKIAAVNWQMVTKQMNEKGYALVSALLSGGIIFQDALTSFYQTSFNIFK